MCAEWFEKPARGDKKLLLCFSSATAGLHEIKAGKSLKILFLSAEEVYACTDIGRSVCVAIYGRICVVLHHV
jgi:hypothetical protein